MLKLKTKVAPRLPAPLPVAAAPEAPPLPEVQQALDGLEAWIGAYGLKGYDPYDALESPILRLLSFGAKWPRIAFTQALKRLPVNLRPLLLVRKTLNPKGLGLLLSGTVRRGRTTGGERYVEAARALAELLLALRAPGYRGACWGYPFPWQSRAFYLPRGTPTIVNTAFVGHALLDVARFLKEERYAAVARSACTFVMRDLARTEEEGALCFSYTPRDDLAVHNANLLGAGLLARVGAATGEAELLDTARRAARWTLRRQLGSGAWWYAEPPYQRWIDSFHTGFVLESLRHVIDGAGLAEAREPLERGYRFFLDHFFEIDGEPRYYHDRKGPLDIHCPTQAIVTMCALDGVAPSPRLLARTTRWLLGNLRAPEGYFYFRRGRFGPNRIPYMRWGQAWAYHGLARLEEFLAGGRSQ
ncbi:MAG TPA: delta-aminolevulinic acid dehydratase [Planctomycetota bacterium]|nr:delta-aminolevulinic acid dehydratase [Planctomycetota bacterium]